MQLNSNILNIGLMKYVLLIIVCALSLCSCDKDKKNDYSFQQYKLSQTIWEGDLLYRDSGKELLYEIRLVFETERIGEYNIERFYPELPYSAKTTFGYEKKDNMLYIDKGFNNILTGNWWVIEFDNHKMVLKRNIIDSLDCSELHLTKMKE